MTYSWITKFFIKSLSPFIPLLSNEIKIELVDFIKKLYTRAKSTNNIWDDFFIKFIADLLGIDVTE